MNEIEATVAKVSDLQEGQMQQVSVGDTKVLLTKLKGQFYAIGAYCSHYGAPLEQGVLSNERVICPWHNACFHVRTGKHLEPPGLDALPCFEVQTTGQDVIVKIPAPVPDQHPPEMAHLDSNADGRRFVILGAGAAGSAAAETLRKEGFQGQILVITQDNCLPYDRTMLSKSFLQGQVDQASLPLRSQQFYANYNIDLRLGQRVTQVDTAQKILTFADNTTLSYDSLLLATGGKARSLPVNGANLKNIFTLRQVTDATQIVAQVQQAKQALVVGSSFISMEAAASLTQQGLAVTVVSRDPVPFETILGREIGQMIQHLHEAKGVRFCLETEVDRFEGQQIVDTAVLKNGDRLPVDLVIVGIGVQPATEILQGIDCNEDHSITVDEYLQAAEGLYAAGDIAQFPDTRTSQPMRIEHWRLAAQQGRTAAHNMLGQRQKFTGVPFFWTGQFDLKLRYVGHATQWDKILIQGEMSEQNFLAFYVQDNRILAVCGCGRDQDIAAISELMRLQKLPQVSVIWDQDMNWIDYLQSQV